MAKSEDENTPLTKLISQLKLAKGSNDVIKSRIASVTILTTMYYLKLIMKINLNFFLLPNRFTRFPL